MEIVIIFLLIAAVAFVVYFQLKGTRPDVIPVQHLAAKKVTKKAAPVAAPVEEKWDTLEVSKKKKSKKTDDESPKKKKKERFDPVAEGKKVLKSDTLKKRETVGKADEEKTADEIKAEKQTRNRLAADGFVVIDEKKAKAKKTKADEEAAPVEKVVEEPVLSEFEERLARLRNVVSGMRPQQNKDGENYTPGAPRGPRAPRADEAPKEEEVTEKKKESSNAFMQKQIDEIRAQARGGKAQSAQAGRKVAMNTTAAPISAVSSGKRGWEKAKPAAPVKVEEEAPAQDEEPAAEEEAAPAEAADEWGAEPETEEF